MHRIRAELQGEHDGRVRGAQGHVLLMSGGLSWWVVRASGMRPTFGGYIRYRGMVCEFTGGDWAIASALRPGSVRVG